MRACAFAHGQLGPACDARPGSPHVTHARECACARAHLRTCEAVQSGHQPLSSAHCSRRHHPARPGHQAAVTCHKQRGQGQRAPWQLRLDSYAATTSASPVCVPACLVSCVRARVCVAWGGVPVRACVCLCVCVPVRAWRVCVRVRSLTRSPAVGIDGHAHKIRLVRVEPLHAHASNNVGLTHTHRVGVTTRCLRQGSSPVFTSPVKRCMCCIDQVRITLTSPCESLSTFTFLSATQKLFSSASRYIC